jgi:hypothetical protein
MFAALCHDGHAHSGGLGAFLAPWSRCFAHYQLEQVSQYMKTTFIALQISCRISLSVRFLCFVLDACAKLQVPPHVWLVPSLPGVWADRQAQDFREAAGGTRCCGGVGDSSDGSFSYSGVSGGIGVAPATREVVAGECVALLKGLHSNDRFADALVRIKLRCEAKVATAATADAASVVAASGGPTVSPAAGAPSGAVVLPVVLLREPSNAIDSNAIKARTRAATKLYGVVEFRYNLILCVFVCCSKYVILRIPRYWWKSPRQTS